MESLPAQTSNEVEEVYEDYDDYGSEENSGGDAE